MINSTNLNESGQLTPEENCPPVRVEVSVNDRVSFRVRADSGNCSGVVPWLGLGFGLGLVLGLGEQFSSGAIVLEPILKFFCWIKQNTHCKSSSDSPDLTDIFS